jgi:hypothetical protein
VQSEYEGNHFGVNLLRIFFNATLDNGDLREVTSSLSGRKHCTVSDSQGLFASATKRS